MNQLRNYCTAEPYGHGMENPRPALEESHVVPVSASPSRMNESQKQQRTLEYLLKINNHDRFGQVSPDELYGNAHALGSNSDNESESTKVLNTLCQDQKKSGDWKDNADIWNVKPHASANVLMQDVNTSNWKYRNLYSMSNSNRHNYWNSRYADITESLQQELAKENKSNCLYGVREYLASYQESYGTPRTEYSYAALITVMGQATGRALLALFYIIVNITPVVEIFLHILRFILDKIINILNTTDRQQMVVKHLILGVQLLTIYICLVFIFGFIVMPMIQMVVSILTKILMFS